MRLAIPDGLTRAVAKQVLATKKNSPHIFFAAGIVGAIGSTVLACRATLKLEEKLDEIHKDIEKVRATEGLTESETNRLVILKVSRGVVKVGRLYGPSIVLGGAAVAALAGSHAQLTRRNSALTGSLAMITQAFEEYRQRVRDEIGEEKERDIYYGIEHEERMIDGKKQLVPVRGPDGLTPFARVFDANSWLWEKYPELNITKIKVQEQYLNDRMDMYGYAFLNEAYEALGLSRSSEGAIYGWVRPASNEPMKRITFGLDEIPSNISFLQGHENYCLLDFNVDGVIYDLVTKLNGDRR